MEEPDVGPDNTVVKMVGTTRYIHIVKIRRREKKIQKNIQLIKKINNKIK